MGILARFKDIISANVNALLDKCEDPAKMIDQYLRNLSDDLAQVKRETSEVMAAESRAARDLEKSKKEAEKFADLAEKAVLAGNDDDARVFLAKKQKLDAEVANRQKTYDVAHDNAVKMRQMHDKLVNDINELNARKESIKAKVAVAKTQQRINNINSTVSNASGAMSAFDRMEQKADSMLDSANAMAELNERPTDDADSLAKKYAVSDTSVDDELAKLKAKLGKN